MRLVLLAAISGLILSGCGSASNKAVPEPEEPAFKIVYNSPAREPDLETKSDLEMVVGDKSVKVGAASETLREIFPKPEKAVEMRQSAPNFPDDYISRGWEADEESVGWLSYSGQTVLVLHNIRHVDESEIQPDFVDKYTKLFRGIEPTIVVGRTAKFWFWQDGSHRFMLTAGKSRKGGMDVTEVIGDVAVMDALRMAPSKAELDKDRADAAWAEDARKAAEARATSKK